jgi:GNAT superfamily N-acetyltransferase
MLTFGPAETDAHLQQILELQAANLPQHITPAEALEQGFVTVCHELGLLREMNEPHRHSLAWSGSELAGYALVMEPRFRARIPVLIPMFELLDDLPWHGRPLRHWRYFVMGQVCVAKAYRGQGAFAGLYHDLQARLRSSFDVVVTEISMRNPRSVRAHEKIGFEPLHRYIDPDGEDWLVVGWPL